jgi:outer membrane receptor protein involved in Fe transport
MRRGLCVLLFAAVPLFAQTTASLEGVVRSKSTGEPVPDVTVSVSSAALQGERTTASAANGEYKFDGLPPGRYVMRFLGAGYTGAPTEVVLRVAVTTRVDVRLDPATRMHDSITVTRPSIPVTQQVASNLTLREVDKLPVLRNQLATAQVVAGVTANTLANGELQISGGPGYDNLALVNGVVVNENVRGQMRPLYIEDAIAETTVLTGAIPAEYGRFTGGVIDTITRSGGNDISGSLRDSLSNPAWSAQTPAGEARNNHLNHVFEATFGGYVLRDRLWFFTAARAAKNDTARQTLSIPAFGSGATASAASPAVSYSESNDQKRYEGKLTAQLGARHNVVGSFLKVDTVTQNSRSSNNIYDLASLTSNRNPDSLAAVRDDVIAGPNTFVEAQASRRTFGLQSGAPTTDVISGTLLLDRANSNARFGAPAQCSVCGSEHRDNRDVLAKVHRFQATRSGTHDLVAGADAFEGERQPNAHQSGSDFSLFVTRVQWKDGVIYPVITPTSANGGNAFIRWSPVLVAATRDHLNTHSLFAADRWSPSVHWTFDLGARWDRNHAQDADGNVSVNDARWSPRLAVQYDVHGDGFLRVNASYSEYASSIAENIATANQSAGTAAQIDFAYRGPAINANGLTVSLPDALRMVFDSFANQGGTSNTAAANLRANGSRSIPGYSAYFDGTLRSPYVREQVLGISNQMTPNLFVRADYVVRDWRDFYAASVTTATRHVQTPLGVPVDLSLMRNTSALARNYRGVQFQTQYRRHPLEAGVYYTYSKLRGNDDGENNNGPVANSDASAFYPEFLNYARFSPRGWLQGDERHRVRAWASYTFHRDFIASLFQSYDSGQPYSAAGPINVTRYAGAPANPGYNAIPNGQYFFSDRGAFRTDNIASTSLALRYTHRVSRGEVFLQGDLLNAFNAHGIADPTRVSTTVTTAATSSAYQPFNPYTETPVRGVHYELAPNFGQALNDLAYQTPRTYRFSLGVRF